MVCTAVSNCRPGVKCRGSMSDLRAVYGLEFFLDVADLSPSLPYRKLVSEQMVKKQMDFAWSAIYLCLVLNG